MSKQTTAVLSIGPLASGSWGDTQPWRVSSHSQLIENGIPYWLVTPTQPAEHSVGSESLVVEIPDAQSVVQSVLMIAATWHGGDDIVGYLMDHENLTLVGEVRMIAPYWELSDESVCHLSSKLAERVKLGFTLMDDMCLVDAEVIETLRNLGFQVDVFARQPQLSLSTN
jgi:hypothetical protein